MSQIYNRLMRAETQKQRGSNESVFSQRFVPEEAGMARDTVINFPQEKMETPKLVKGPGEKGAVEEQTTPALSPFFVELAGSIKTHLDAIKTLAELSRGKFKDPEFENHFIKAIHEYIRGTDAGLNCYSDFLKVRSPVRAKNRVHTILEEILDGNKKAFEDRRIQIVKKQFEKDLPETSVPEDHLRYILHWVVQYASSSLSANGHIGFLTRPFDFRQAKEDPRAFRETGRKAIEIIVFFITQEEVGEPSGKNRHAQAWGRGNGNHFILSLVEEIVMINQGTMRVKVDSIKHWTQISLILPV